MSEYSEETLAATATAHDRQIALLRWKRYTPRNQDGTGQPVTELGYTVTIFDGDGNAIATIARIDCGTSVAAVFEHKAWDLYIALVDRLSTGAVFDLGAGPDRQAA